MTGLRAAPRTGPWCAIRDREAGGPWRVWNSETGAFLRSAVRRRCRGWKRRAHAYAEAERLNREDATRAEEALRSLGL